jgi:hypothetical protein
VPTDERTVVDHVIYGVRNLEAAVQRFDSEYGLKPIARASHPGWGTCNAVVPVGTGQFIELLAIADPGSDTPLVNGLRRLLADGDRTAGVCLRPPDFDAVVERLALKVMPGERDEGDRVLRFRRTIVERDPGFPFFIDWQGAEREMDDRYGDAAATDGIAWIELGGDEGAIRHWVADDTVPIHVVPGRRGPRRFALRTTTGAEITIS